jgi:ribosome-binding ATPase
VVVNNSDEDDALPDTVFEEAEAMVVRGKLEMEMAQLSEADATVFRQDFGLSDSALDRVVARSYALLRLATFFTVGEDEVRAWTIPGDLPAQEAAGVVHTDMQKGFIRAEVVAYDDLHRAGDFASARKLGLVRLEGKTYPVRDGDIINFRFNV